MEENKNKQNHCLKFVYITLLILYSMLLFSTLQKQNYVCYIIPFRQYILLSGLYDSFSFFFFVISFTLLLVSIFISYTLNIIVFRYVRQNKTEKKLNSRPTKKKKKKQTANPKIQKNHVPKI